MSSDNSPQILLVDDEQSVRRLIRTFLERSGFAVIEACDAVEALDLFRQNEGQIDLLLTDIMMPRMTGSELATQVRSQNRSLPILFMSAYCDTLDPSLRDIECLAKPFSNEELIAKVQETLGGQQRSATIRI